MKFFFNEKPEDDVVAILAFINGLAEVYCPDTGISIDVPKIQMIAQGIRMDFPHNDGLEQASIFKQVSNFMTYFISERPILASFSNPNLPSEILKIRNHENATVALLLGFAALHNASIVKDEKTVNLSEPIKLSKHSFIDMVDALANITPSLHFKVLTVLLEQISYKTNPECQYTLHQFN
ncbi:MAG: hypothetical protein Q7U54_03755 [Bacteroidales bacterium]|nr:hypothetical protein [Bacteroidales bacterium]